MTDPNTYGSMKLVFLNHNTIFKIFYGLFLLSEDICQSNIKKTSKPL